MPPLPRAGQILPRWAGRCWPIPRCPRNWPRATRSARGPASTATSASAISSCAAPRAAPSTPAWGGSGAAPPLARAAARRTARVRQRNWAARRRERRRARRGGLTVLRARRWLSGRGRRWRGGLWWWGAGRRGWRRPGLRPSAVTASPSLSARRSWAGGRGWRRGWMPIPRRRSGSPGSKRRPAGRAWRFAPGQRLRPVSWQRPMRWWWLPARAACRFPAQICPTPAPPSRLSRCWRRARCRSPCWGRTPSAWRRPAPWPAPDTRSPCFRRALLRRSWRCPGAGARWNCWKSGARSEWRPRPFSPSSPAACATATPKAKRRGLRPSGW